MAGQDHFDGQAAESGERGLRLLAVQHQDVRVILLRFFHYNMHVVLVVEAAVRGQVLAEGVVGEQDLFLRAVSDHAVGPVEHRRRHEGQRARAEGERLAGLDRLIGQLAVAAGQPLEAVGRAGDDLRVRAAFRDDG